MTKKLFSAKDLLVTCYVLEKKFKDYDFSKFAISDSGNNEESKALKLIKDVFGLKNLKKKEIKKKNMPYFKIKTEVHSHGLENEKTTNEPLDEVIIYHELYILKYIYDNFSSSNKSNYNSLIKESFCEFMGSYPCIVSKQLDFFIRLYNVSNLFGDKNYHSDWSKIYKSGLSIKYIDTYNSSSFDINLDEIEYQHYVDEFIKEHGKDFYDNLDIVGLYTENYYFDKYTFEEENIPKYETEEEYDKVLDEYYSIV